MSPSTSLFRPYYYGKYRWDDYALDIAEAAEAGANLQRQSLRVQAKTMNLAQDQATELRRQGELQREELAGIRVVVDRMDQQIELFSQANARLEEIHKTLRNPRTTEADELFRQGEYCFRQGLYEESLDAFLKAEQIYKVNYLLQFRIGSLFLEGRNRKSNVIDLAQAEPHLLLATRYAEAEYQRDSTAKHYAGEAYFRAAKTCYLLGEQQHKMANTRQCARTLIVLWSTWPCRLNSGRKTPLASTFRRNVLHFVAKNKRPWRGLRCFLMGTGPTTQTQCGMATSRLLRRYSTCIQTRIRLTRP